MLNHKEENIGFVARNSLQLDMNKRNVPRVFSRENFLGFAVKQDGKFLTNTKGGFGVPSDWPQLNLLACKIGIVLVWQNAEAIDLMNARNLNVVVNGEMFDFSTTGQL